MTHGRDERRRVREVVYFGIGLSLESRKQVLLSDFISKISRIAKEGKGCSMFQQFSFVRYPVNICVNVSSSNLLFNWVVELLELLCETCEVAGIDLDLPQTTPDPAQLSEPSCYPVWLVFRLGPR